MASQTCFSRFLYIWALPIKGLNITLGMKLLQFFRCSIWVAFPDALIQFLGYFMANGLRNSFSSQRKITQQFFLKGKKLAHYSRWAFWPSCPWKCDCCSPNKYLLNAQEVAGMPPEPRDRVVNKTERNSCPHRPYRTYSKQCIRHYARRQASWGRKQSKNRILGGQHT